MSKRKLELTWDGKDEPLMVEPRILLYDEKNSSGDQSTGNMLIHGDNLLALKALEDKFEGQVKCVYIDPPFNTGQAFENYDDNMEISLWLNLMYHRLEIIHKLMSKDGTLLVHMDDGYLAYLTIMLDEIFGRNNRLYLVTFKQGAATGHKAINPGCITNTNFILIYAKSKSDWCPNKVYTKRDRDTRYGKYIVNIDSPFNEWKIITLTEAFAEEINEDLKTTRKIIKNNPSLIDKFVIEHSNSVIRTARPDIKNVGKNVVEKVNESKDNPDVVVYLHRENDPDMYFINGERIIFYSNKTRNIDGEIVTAEPLTTLWDDILSNNLHNEGGVKFPKSKKPEHLIKRVLELTTNPGDLVLDSFLGSGTTAAVAHKMNRRYIGIEMGDHAYTHCKVRLDKIIDGNDAGGISKAVEWKSGGGYRFYELAGTLVKLDSHGEHIISDEYDAEKLAAAVALHEGYTYAPNKECFWKQAIGTENSYLFTTTRTITMPYLESIAQNMNANEFLTIMAASFSPELSKAYKNITLKNIPETLLARCTFGVDDYSLPIIDPPQVEENENDEEDCDNEE